MPDKEGQRRLESFLKIISAFVFAAAVITAVVSTNSFDSQYGAAAAGREIVRQMGLPDTMPFSYTGPLNWNKTGWLSDVAVYAGSIAAGIRGVYILKCAAYMLAFWLLFLTVYRRQQKKYVGIVLPFSAAGAVLLLSGMQLSGITPVLFTAYFIFVLEKKPVMKNMLLLATLPPAALLWANTATSAVIAPVLMALYLIFYLIESAEQKEKKAAYNFPVYLIFFAAAAAASIASPLLRRGPLEFYNSIMKAGFHSGYDYRHNIIFIIPLYLYAAVAAGLIIYNTRTGPDRGSNSEFIKDVLLFAGMLALALVNAAFIPLFLAVTIPVGAYYLYQLFRWDIVWLRKWTETDLLRVKVPIYLLLIVFMSVVLVVFAGPMKLHSGPEKAVSYILREGIPANLYAPDGWTGYLEYRLYPAYGVYGRNDGSENISGLAGQYNINSILLPFKKGTSLNGTKFKPAYFDDESVLFVNSEKTDKYFEFVYPGEPADFYDRKNQDKAVQELSDFYEKYPSKAVILMLARIHADKDPNEAIDFVQDASERNPGNMELKILLGRLYYQEGQYENAVEAWGARAFVDPELRVLANDARKKMKRTE
jgi:hypothetical protein